MYRRRLGVRRWTRAISFGFRLRIHSMLKARCLVPVVCHLAGCHVGEHETVHIGDQAAIYQNANGGLVGAPGIHRHLSHVHHSITRWGPTRGRLSHAQALQYVSICVHLCPDDEVAAEITPWARAGNRYNLSVGVCKFHRGLRQLVHGVRKPAAGAFRTRSPSVCRIADFRIPCCTRAPDGQLCKYACLAACGLVGGPVLYSGWSILQQVKTGIGGMRHLGLLRC